MSIDVKKIAHLARIEIDDAKIEQYQQELTKILGLVGQMNTADEILKNTAPMSHPLDVDQRLREDIVTEKDQRELFQQSTPHTAHGLYLVEKVIE